MINIIGFPQIVKPKFKKLALASAITLTGLTSCANSSSNDNVAQLRRDSVELTNQINSLERDMLILNNINYFPNDSSSTSLEQLNTYKQEKDSIKQAKKAQLTYVTEKLQEAKKNSKNIKMPIEGKMLFTLTIILGLAYIVALI